MPRRRRSEPPALTESDALALREEMQRRFPCRSWECDDDALDGSVAFRCECGERTGRYPSYADGAQVMGEHLDAVDEARNAYFVAWAHQREPDAMVFFRYQEPERRRADTIADRVRRRPQPPPAWQDDFPRVTGPHRSKHDPGPQYGLANLLLHRVRLVGVVSTPLRDLAARLELRVERSFGELHDCDIAYVEHEGDAFTLVRWEPTQNVEVSAYVPRDADGRGVAQLERFLDFAGLTWDDVVFPPRGLHLPRVEPEI